MSFNVNNVDYAIRTDSEFAELLRYFNTDFIRGLIDTNITNNFRPFVSSVPNLVKSYELSFKNALIDYPEKTEELNQLRQDTYILVINTICQRFDLSISMSLGFDENTLDAFTLASLMYDFFISNYTQNMVFFFSNYIIKNKKMIYDAFNLVNYKKNKDASTLHAKKMYDDTELAAIIANTSLVLSNIRSFDISIEEIFKTIFTLPEPAGFVCNTIQDKNDFYKTFFSLYCNEENELNPTFVTMVKLELQKSLVPVNIINQ